jgi:hypothetical protein
MPGNLGLEILSAMVLLSLAIILLQWLRHRRQPAPAADENKIVLDRKALAAVVAVLGLGLVSSAMVQGWRQFAATTTSFPAAQPDGTFATGTPPPPPPVSAVPGGAQSMPPAIGLNLDGGMPIGGVVRAFNYGPAGDVDGLILNSGVIIHFPPEQSSQVTPLAPLGSRVQIRGWSHIGPAGDQLIDAQNITNRQTGASISLAAPPIGPPPPPGR